RGKTFMIGKPQAYYGPLGPTTPPLEFWQWEGAAWTMLMSSATPTHLNFGFPSVYDGYGLLISTYFGFEPNFGYQTWRLDSTQSPGATLTQTPQPPYQEFAPGSSVVYSAAAAPGATFQ